MHKNGTQYYYYYHYYYLKKRPFTVKIIDKRIDDASQQGSVLHFDSQHWFWQSQAVGENDHRLKRISPIIPVEGVALVVVVALVVHVWRFLQLILSPAAISVEKQPTGGSKYKDSSFLDSGKFWQPIRMLLRPKLMKIFFCFLFFFLEGVEEGAVCGH